MSKTLVIKTPNLTWSELSAVFNRASPYHTGNLVERPWCEYVMVTPTGVYYLPHQPVFELDDSVVWVDESSWPEVVLLTDKLSKTQLIEYFSN